MKKQSTNAQKSLWKSNHSLWVWKTLCMSILEKCKKRFETLAVCCKKVSEIYSRLTSFRFFQIHTVDTNSNWSTNCLKHVFIVNNRHQNVAISLLLSKAATPFSLWGNLLNFEAPISTSGSQRIAAATWLYLVQNRWSQEGRSCHWLYSVQNRGSQRTLVVFSAEPRVAEGRNSCDLTVFSAEPRVVGGSVPAVFSAESRVALAVPAVFSGRIKGRTAPQLYSVQSWRLYSAQNWWLQEGLSCDTAVFSTEPMLEGPGCRI